jgi:hypothetical protein
VAVRQLALDKQVISQSLKFATEMIVAEEQPGSTH